MNTYEIGRAAHVLRRGGVVVNATEGVWGLCCDADDETAVLTMLAIKRRSWREGLILVAHAADVFGALLADLDAGTRALMHASWPGPVTWLVPHLRRVPPWIHGSSTQVALRVTAHPQFAALCERFGGALASTSANRTGRPPVASAARARIELGPGVDYVLPGELGGAAGPSTIVDAATLEVRRGEPTDVPGLIDARRARGLH